MNMITDQSKSARTQLLQVRNQDKVGAASPGFPFASLDDIGLGRAPLHASSASVVDQAPSLLILFHYHVCHLLHVFEK
jgi:hypothetical protein